MNLINSEEASQILAVNKSRLHQMTREGLIRARPVRGANMYDPNEVYQLKEIRASDITLVEVAARAARAEMTAYRLERQVTQLINVIGADIPSADITPEAVVAQHLKVEDELASHIPLSVDGVLLWAQTFQSLSEQYFHVVADQFLLEKPWKPYVKLSNKFIRAMPHTRLRRDLELYVAYNYLELARRSMRQAMFFYAFTTYGKRLAYSEFPEAYGDVHEDVMTMLSRIVD